METQRFFSGVGSLLYRVPCVGAFCAVAWFVLTVARACAGCV